MCFGCTLSFGDMSSPDWMRWDDHPVRQDYNVIMDLGEGAFSQVVLGQSKDNPKRYVAMKVVYLQSPEVLEDPEHVAIMRREAEFLQMLDHPNIVECFGTVENTKQLVILMEWLRGGHLLDTLEDMSGEHYSEQQAAILFVQLAEALECMARKNLLHRDIKAENIVFADTAAQAAAKGVPPVVKFIDLGMATLYDKSHPQTGALGSPGFVAPEIILNQEHTPAMDVFSLGVVLFIMLVGRKPFNIKECENLSYCNLDLRAAPGLEDPRWQSLSPAAKSLLMGMLEFDPAKRLTAKQVCQHDWVASRGGLVPRLLDPGVARGAANVASVRRLRNMVHGVVALKQLRRELAGEAGHEWEHSVRARNEMTKRLTRRRDRELGSLHAIALQLNSRALAKKHDAGQTADPGRDLSVHGRRAYMGGAGDVQRECYYSVHGAHAAGLAQGGVASSRRLSSSVHGGEGGPAASAGAFLLKPSGTAVLLSEMAPGVTTPDDSWRNGAQLVKSNSAGDAADYDGAKTPRSGAAAAGGSTGSLLRAIARDLKDLASGGGGPKPRNSPGALSGGSSKRSLLQRLSSTLQDVSVRGRRRGDEAEDGRSGGGSKPNEAAAPTSAGRENGVGSGASLEHAYSAPVRVLRVRPLVDDSTLGQAFADLPDISEASRSLEAGHHAGGAQSTGAASRLHAASQQ